MRRAALGFAPWLAAAAGCAVLAPGLPRGIAECDGTLPSTRDLPPGDWLLRERVRVSGGPGGDVDVGFELVAEKRGDRLVVVGFHALGAKAFSIVQRGRAVEAESHLGRALPVPPGNLLRDLYAAGLAEASPPAHAEVARPGCGYRATFALVSRRGL